MEACLFQARRVAQGWASLAHEGWPQSVGETWVKAIWGVGVSHPIGVFSLHWASGPPRTGLETDFLPSKMEWKSLGRFLGRPTVCLPETKWGRRPTHQPIKWSSTEYLAMFTHFRSHTRIIGKGNLFDFATIFTNSTKLHWRERERQPEVKEMDSELTFFWSYKQRIVSFPETPVRPHWLAPKSSGIAHPMDLFGVKRALG